MKMHHRLILIMLIILLLVSCSQKKEQANQPTPEENSEQTATKEQTQDEDSKEESKTSDEQDKIKELALLPLPQTLQEVEQYPLGKFTATKDAGVEEALNKVPNLPEDISLEEEQAILAYLYSLFKMEHKLPEQAFADIQEIDGSDSDETRQIETVNIEIILDASGSMGKKIGQKTMMEIAKEAIKEFTASLPKEANVGLRVYGHKGSGSNADKAISCASNELVYPIQPYNEANLSAALTKFNPAGWTPLAQAMIEAEKDLASYKGEHYRNIMYVVSDGIETCGGDPIAAAKSLKGSEISPIVNIIGFAVSGKDQQQLKDVATAAGGTYVDVRNLDQMNEQFKRASEEAGRLLYWKIGEELSAINEHNKQFLAVRNVLNKWSLDLNQEKYQIYSALLKLQLKDKMTDKQFSRINDYLDEFYKKQQEQIDELDRELGEIREENYKEKLKKINELYEGKYTDLN